MVAKIFKVACPLSLSPFNMVLTDLVFDTYYNLAGATMTLAGSASGTVDGGPIDSELDNFKIVFNSDSYGEFVSISGKIRDACLDGWITVKTEAPIYTPNWANCPTAGEMTISSGEDSIKAKIKSNSEITVFFNDSLIETYGDCEEINGLCAG